MLVSAPNQVSVTLENLSDCSIYSDTCLYSFSPTHYIHLGKDCLSNDFKGWLSAEVIQKNKQKM